MLVTQLLTDTSYARKLFQQKVNNSFFSDANKSTLMNLIIMDNEERVASLQQFYLNCLTRIVSNWVR